MVLMAHELAGRGTMKPGTTEALLRTMGKNLVELEVRIRKLEEIIKTGGKIL
jgi:hypothetical protein